MDSLFSSVDSHAVLVIAAIAVSLLLGSLLLRILKVGLGTILTIVAIVLVLKYGFGISPALLWREIANLPQEVVQIFRSLDLNA